MDLGLLLVVILIVVFVWRGPKTLPELGRMFGEGVRAVRREARRAPDHDRDSSGPPEQGGR
jgi:Sec-independent protein translocase protein TatA